IYLANKSGVLTNYIIKQIKLKDRYTDEEIEFITKNVDETITQLEKVKGIVNYLKSLTHNKDLYIIEDFFESKTLDQFIKKRKAIEEKEIWAIVIQIVLIFYSLARSELYMVNLKNDNIFINDKLEIRLNYLTITKILN